MTRSMASGMLMGKLRSLVPSTSQCTVAINQFKRDRSANRMRFDDAELDELARGAHFFPTLRIALPDDRWTQPPSEDDRGSSPRHDDDELSAAARASNLRGDEATQPSPGGAAVDRRRFFARRCVLRARQRAGPRTLLPAFARQLLGGGLRRRWARRPTALLRNGAKICMPCEQHVSDLSRLSCL